MRSLILRWFVSAGMVSCFAASSHAQVDPQQKIVGVDQPQIIAGTLVSLATQKELGLVTVAGGCSGTLVNRFWVLTADHCVSMGAVVNGPAAPFANVAITAAWSDRTVIPTRFVRWGTGLDVALIFLGAGDFGSDRNQLFFVGQVDTTMRMMKFGRGRPGYASAGPPPMPAPPGGTYRSATFTVSAADAGAYTLPVNDAGQVGYGGDSGGPDFVLAPNNMLLGIAGVLSTCTVTGRVPGMPADWNWVTQISDCSSAAIETVRFDILQIIQEGRTPCPGPSVACAIPETTSLTLLLH